MMPPDKMQLKFGENKNNDSKLKFEYRMQT